MKLPREFIERDDSLALDDVVLRCDYVHIERMSDGHIWIGIDGPGARYIAFDFYANKKRDLRWTQQ